MISNYPDIKIDYTYTYTGIDIDEESCQKATEELVTKLNGKVTIRILTI